MNEGEVMPSARGCGEAGSELRRDAVKGAAHPDRAEPTPEQMEAARKWVFKSMGPRGHSSHYASLATLLASREAALRAELAQAFANVPAAAAAFERRIRDSERDKCIDDAWSHACQAYSENCDCRMEIIKVIRSRARGDGEKEKE